MEVRTTRKGSIIVLQEDLKKDVDNKVQNWLENETSPQFEIDIREEKTNEWIKTLLFLRSVISIKSFGNEWDIWHIATSTQLNKIYHHYKITITINDYVPNFIAFPNEIKSEGYGFSARKPINALLGIYGDPVKIDDTILIEKETK